MLPKASRSLHVCPPQAHKGVPIYSLAYNRVTITTFEIAATLIGEELGARKVNLPVRWAKRLSFSSFLNCICPLQGRIGYSNPLIIFISVCSLNFLVDLYTG